MDTRISFKIKGMGFPSGQIYRMCIWFEGQKENPGKWLDDNVDVIKEQMKGVCNIHAIEFDFVTYTNTRKDNEKYGDLILNKIIQATPSKNKKYAVNKKVTKIDRIDLPNITKDNLITLRDKIDVELFKRGNELSDDVYDFFKANEDIVTVDQAKEINEKHGVNDMFFLRKREIRKIVEGKTKFKLKI